MTALLVQRPGTATPLSPGRGLTSALSGTGAARLLLARALPWLVRGIMVVAVVAFAGLAVGPHVLGYRTLTMLTGSMSPAIDPGDVAVVTPVAVQDVTAGMVITYHIPIDDHRLVTHRVIGVERGADGSVTVQTKGDANETADPWKATLQGETVYRLRAVVPELGSLIQALRTPVVAQLLTYGATGLVAGWLLLGLWRPTNDKEDRA